MEIHGIVDKMNRKLLLNWEILRKVCKLQSDLIPIYLFANWINNWVRENEKKYYVQIEKLLLKNLHKSRLWGKLEGEQSEEYELSSA